LRLHCTPSGVSFRVQNFAWQATGAPGVCSAPDGGSGTLRPVMRANSPRTSGPMRAARIPMLAFGAPHSASSPATVFPFHHHSLCQSLCRTTPRSNLALPGRRTRQSMAPREGHLRVVATALGPGESLPCLPATRTIRWHGFWATIYRPVAACLAS